MFQTTVGILCAGILLLTGCASPTPPTADELYVHAVRISAPTLEGIDAETLTRTGKGVCSALDRGITADALLERALRGLQFDEANALIDHGIRVYCPQHTRAVSI